MNDRAAARLAADVLPAGSSEAPPPPGVDRGTLRVLAVGLVLVVVLQRLALPVGEQGISLTLPIGYAVLGLLLLRGAVEHDQSRTMLFLLAAGGCGLMVWAATWRSTPPALMSYLLLLSVYVPWLFRLRGTGPRHELATRLGVVYIRLMTVAAAIAIGQLAVQLGGAWTYHDVLADRVPEDFLLGDYNTVTVLEYGSTVVKSQAFVFLEPSFLCQYLALGIVLALLLRTPVWQPLLMGMAMVTTFSGTGFALLLVAFVLFLLRSHRSLRPSLLASGVVVGVLLISTPLATPLLERSEETSDDTSSWSLRFELPYREVAEGFAEEPQRYLVGAGPGTVERFLENDKQGAGLAVVYPVAPKILFEYGVPVGLLFLAFWVVALVRRAPWPVVPGALVVMLGALSGSLQQPHTILLAWLLSVVLARE